DAGFAADGRSRLYARCRGPVSSDVERVVRCPNVLEIGPQGGLMKLSFWLAIPLPLFVCVAITTSCHKPVQPLDKARDSLIREQLSLALRGDLPDAAAGRVVLDVRLATRELPKALRDDHIRVLERSDDLVTITGLQSEHWRSLLLDSRVSTIGLHRMNTVK